MGVAAGAGLGGHNGAGEEAGWKSGYSQVVSGLYEHFPLEGKVKGGKEVPRDKEKSPEAS